MGSGRLLLHVLVRSARELWKALDAPAINRRHIRGVVAWPLDEREPWIPGKEVDADCIGCEKCLHGFEVSQRDIDRDFKGFMFHNHIQFNKETRRAKKLSAGS